MDGVTAATMQVFPFADHSCVMCGRDEIRSEASKSRIRVDATATRILPVQGVAKPAIPTILETIAQSLMVFATCERSFVCAGVGEKGRANAVLWGYAVSAAVYVPRRREERKIWMTAFVACAKEG